MCYFASKSQLLRLSESLARRFDPAPENELANRKIDQSEYIDEEDEAYECHDCDSDLPLYFRIDSTPRNEEDHHVLHRDYAEFIKVLKPIVKGFFVGLDRSHIPKVKTLETIIRQYEPDALDIQNKREEKQCADEKKSSDAKD